MLDSETKRRIDNARDILVGKVPDPKAQVEQITTALIYKFMDDMDKESEELGGKIKFFTNGFGKYSWTKLMDPKLGGFDRLNLYSEAIQKMSVNPHLPQLFRDIFKDAFLPYRDPETLNLFLKEINGFIYDHSERLGDAFEYLLSVLGSQGDAGQFRTPRHIIDFIVQVIDPKKDETILDPACGTAGFLISAYKHILRVNTKDKKGDSLTPDEKKRLMKNFTGYDISPDMVRISLVNMYLHDFPNPTVYEYDTLTSEDRWNDGFDVVLANPPFMTPKGGIRPHKRFSVQANRSEVLFVDYIAEHLKNSGRAGVIVPEGIIFQSGNAYKALRKMLVEDGYLYAAVSLPAGVFNPYSGVKTSILLMDKRLAKMAKNILFVKVDNDGFDLGAQRKEIQKNDLPVAYSIIANYQSALIENRLYELSEGDKSLAHLVTKEEIARSDDYNLISDRYKKVVGVAQNKWPMVKLGEVASLMTGGTPLTSKKEYYGGAIKWLVSGDIHKGEIFDCDGRITEIALKESNAKLLPVNSVLIALNGQGKTRGTVAILRTEAACNQSLVSIIPKHGKLIPDFLFYALKGKYQEIRDINGDNQRGGLNMPLIRTIEIPIPPLDIQKEIVVELDGYKKIIDGAKQIVVNWKPEFKVAPEWPVFSLGEVCKLITDGAHRTPNYIEFGVPFLRVTDITSSSESKKYISEGEHSELIKRCRPEKGDVLYTKNGTIGIAKLVDWEWEFSIFVSLALLKPDRERMLGKYLELFLNSELAISQATSHSKSGTVTNLHLVEIKKFKIPLPALEIQNQIVAEIESERTLVESSKQLIEIYEQKIKSKIAELWEE